MTLYARRGEWVTCDGIDRFGKPTLHDIGMLARDIQLGEKPSLDMFDDLLADAPPAEPTDENWGRCPYCPGRFWQAKSAADGSDHGVFHIDYNWRDKPSVGAVPLRPAYDNVDTLVRSEAMRQAAEARYEAEEEVASRLPGRQDYELRQDYEHLPWWWRRIWATIRRILDSWFSTSRRRD